MKPKQVWISPLQQDPSTKDNGKIISNTERALKPGLKELATKVSILKAKNMEKVSTFGQTDQFTMAIGSKTK